MSTSMPYIAVTGASGFIGGRACEYLLGLGYRVRAIVHTYQRAARLSIWPIEIVQADVLDRDALITAFQDVDVVVHCAYGTSPDNALNERVTREGTENVIVAAATAGVRRLVHLSTVAVYGSPLPERVNEDTPYRECTDWYGRSKQLAEKAVLTAHTEGKIEAVVLQPAIVYGPWAGVWTMEPVRRILDGSLYLYDGGKGICNSLYVDNLAEAIHLACTKAGIGGERFLITDGSPTTWGEFFGHYARMLGRSLPMASEEQVVRIESRRRLWLPLIEAVRAAGKTVAGVLTAAGLGQLTEGGKRFFKRQTRWMNRTSPSEMEFYTANTVFGIDRARERLGYTPRYGLAEGMRRTEAWLWFGRMI